MKCLYQVRWLSFDVTVDAVLRSIPALVTFFEHEAQQSDPTAIGIHSCICSYKFLTLTHFVKDILSILTKLSLTFQLTDIDVSVIQPKVIAAVDALDNMKTEDGPFLKEFKIAYDNGDYVLYNISDSTSQRTSFNTARRQFIDALKINLSNRFIDTGLLSAFKIVYPKHYPPSVSTAAQNKFGEQELEVIIEHYCPSSSESSSLPPPLDSSQLRSEYQLFRPFIIRNFQNFQFDQFATTFLQLHFLEMAKLIQIILVIPVTSVPCERGFSASNRIKTRLRNRLYIDTVDTLLRISLEGKLLNILIFLELCQCINRQDNTEFSNVTHNIRISTYCMHFYILKKKF